MGVDLETVDAASVYKAFVLRLFSVKIEDNWNGRDAFRYIKLSLLTLM